MRQVRSYKPGDAERLAPRMREADKAEVFAATGDSPLTALKRGEGVSVPLCTILDDQHNVIGIFGAVPDAEDNVSASVWMLGADALIRSPLKRWFLRECPKYIDGLNNLYPMLHGCIDARNTVHVQWLRWMGFTFISTIEQYGYEKRPFMEFVRVKQNV